MLQTVIVSPSRNKAYFLPHLIWKRHYTSVLLHLVPRLQRANDRRIFTNTKAFPFKRGNIRSCRDIDRRMSKNLLSASRTTLGPSPPRLLQISTMKLENKCSISNFMQSNLLLHGLNAACLFLHKYPAYYQPFFFFQNKWPYKISKERINRPTGKRN